MKKSLFTLVLLFAFVFHYGQQWVAIHSDKPVRAEKEMLSSDVMYSQVRFSVEGFFTSPVETPRGTQQIISLDKASPILLKGAPGLPKLTASVIISDEAGMEARVISSSFTEYENIEIAPSKGNFTRDIDPADVPYTYGRQYQEDRFFPEKLTELRTPYIIRDHRGQTIVCYAFQYNPVRKVLRVYDEILVEIYEASEKGINPLYHVQESKAVDEEFRQIYEQHFLNSETGRYDPVEEQGNLLIISHGDFMAAMDPYIDWKIKTGRHTEIVDVASIGNNSNDIKTYIANYYNDNGLAYVLLVGDATQVTSSYSNGDSDVDYSYVVGNDHYPDLFVGRFSAENVAQVETQVQRTLDYEQAPYQDTDWFPVNIGVSSDQGPGDDNEYDYEHIRNIQTDLIGFTYTTSRELFDGNQGGLDEPGNPTPQMVADEVNDGSSLINYTGHGSTYSWGSSGFSNNDVDNLTNNGMLPFIWSVACVNGNFVGNTCFAEAWLRAENNGEPSGAVATMMSTINQSWNPPMEGQDEMNDILVESYTNNIKRTFGGISFNGCMQMNDEYGSGGDEMTDTWTCFGDPSLMVRTAMPAEMTATYNSSVFIGSTQLSVSCDAEGALAALTSDGVILGTAYVENGIANIQFEALTEVGMLDLVITAFNYLPHAGQVEVIPANGPYVVYESHEINDENANGQLDYGESSFLSISLENIGTEDATNVSATLWTEDEYITVLDGVEVYGDIPAGNSQTVTDGFEIMLAEDIPDGHSILFILDIGGDGDEVWTSNFAESGHAPLLVYLNYNIDDSNGNDNGKMDPGETVDLTISVSNDGTSEAFNILGDLSSVSQFVDIAQSQMDYGDIAGGATAEQIYSVTADAACSSGHIADFEILFNGDMGISATGIFNSVIGQIPVLLVDYDGNSSSSAMMESSFQNLGVAWDMEASLSDVDPGLYQSVFVCLGVYPNNHQLSAEDGQQLATYLENGGRLYMEGADTWYYDDQTAVHEMFNIEGMEDGESDLGEVMGQASSIVEGMDYVYDGENNWIDRIQPIEPAIAMFKNLDPEYTCAVSFDEGNHKTIGSSFEFGGLDDGNYNKDELMYEILQFFGIETIWVGQEENLPGNPDFTVYPNPFNNQLNILLEGKEITEVSVYDLLGRKVMKWAVSKKGHLQLETGKLKAGIYYIRLRSGNEIMTQKLIRQ
ncbi:MAG: C25 family cysteine peptidase [Bacteroidota bacterium]|nr:C25 family cysteine peptidase [Bacteroidota bacterium]